MVPVELLDRGFRLVLLPQQARLGVAHPRPGRLEAVRGVALIDPDERLSGRERAAVAEGGSHVHHFAAVVAEQPDSVQDGDGAGRAHVLRGLARRRPDDGDGGNPRFGEPQVVRVRLPLRSAGEPDGHQHADDDDDDLQGSAPTPAFGCGAAFFEHRDLPFRGPVAPGELRSMTGPGYRRLPNRPIVPQLGPRSPSENSTCHESRRLTVM